MRICLSLMLSEPALPRAAVFCGESDGSNEFDEIYLAAPGGIASPKSPHSAPSMSLEGQIPTSRR
jgi:hypothetical protein